MAINVKFGKCHCENEEVDKSGNGMITDWTTDVPCVMLNTDMLNPVLKLSSTYAGYNYAKINDFGGRYYFVEAAESIVGGHCILHCHVDVLYTYCSEILALSCLVMRNEDINKWKRDLTDRCIPASNRRIGYSKTFGTHFVTSGTSGTEYVFGYI